MSGAIASERYVLTGVISETGLPLRSPRIRKKDKKEGEEEKRGEEKRREEERKGE